MNQTFKNGHALIIGVGNDLPVTVQDATAINNIIADSALAGYDPNNIMLLTEKKATRKGILKAFDKLIKNTDEDSTVFIFYSGHGGHYKPWDQFYLVPHNYDPEEYETTWLKAEELQEKISQLKTKKLIFFLDCCHAAGMTKSKEPGDEKTLSKSSLNNADQLVKKLDSGTGISIISSSRQEELSYIMGGDNNSLFTKCLIEVLRGEHKTEFDEPYMRMTEVMGFLFREVPKRNGDQHPYANLEMNEDFVLSYVPQNIRKDIPQPKRETDGFLKQMLGQEMDIEKESMQNQMNLIKVLVKEKAKFIDGTSIYKTELQILEAKEEQMLIYKKIKSLQTKIGS